MLAIVEWFDSQALLQMGVTIGVTHAKLQNLNYNCILLFLRCFQTVQ